MSYEEEMKQLNELYELGLVWIGALEAESKEQDVNLQNLLDDVEDAFIRTRAKMAEISRIMDNGNEKAQ